MSATNLRRGSPGIALASLLLVSMVILTLGIGLLAYCQKDAYFQRRIDNQNRARVLARAGVDLFFAMSLNTIAPDPPPPSLANYPDTMPPLNVQLPPPVSGGNPIITTVSVTPTERIRLEQIIPVIPPTPKNLDYLSVGEVIHDVTGEVLARSVIVIPRGSVAGAYAL